jgi:transcriptional regulator GlxA family with amidase domain
MLLGHSILDEVHCMRVERAKELLAVTDLPVSPVAAQTGFSTSQRMAKVFPKVVGMALG